MDRDFPMELPKGKDDNKVTFTCNCGHEIEIIVEPDDVNEVRCEQCGQDYSFYGRSVLR